jgi:hypothetical protein
VVKCGSWLELSTRAILFAVPNATVEPVVCDEVTTPLSAEQRVEVRLAGEP